MSKRLLLGCIAALAAMLVFDLLATLTGLGLDLSWRTRAGTIPFGSLAITFAAMLLGGWIARRRFRWVAVGLTAALWLAVIATLMLIAAPPMDSLATILRFNGLAAVSGLLLAWLGAVLGERLAERGHRREDVAAGN